MRAFVEPALVEAARSSETQSGAQTNFQFMRKGYFILDSDSTAVKPVFNRTVTLKDTYAKEMKKG